VEQFDEVVMVTVSPGVGNIFGPSPFQLAVDVGEQSMFTT
jgi:hypothetical protein